MKKRLSPAQLFGIKFFSVLIAASIFIWAVQLTERLGVVQSFLARSAGILASLVGSDNSVLGDRIAAGGLSMEINFECTGLYVLVILLTFLLAYPASWRSRILGASIGVVALTAVNIFRIAVLIRVVELQPALFDYLHEYVWQGLFLVLVIAYAMSWVENVK